MASDGWIKLYRKFLDWEWYKTPNMAHLFIHILVSANHEDGKWQGIDIKRGQLITGRKSLSEDTGISEKAVRTCLSRLEKTGEIRKQTASKFSIITICHYEQYQEKETTEGPAKGQQRASKGPAKGHKQEEEEGKEGKEKRNTGVIAFTPPTVDEVRVYCQERGNSIDPEYFVDKYTGNGWMVGKNKMKCWKATIRTWEKNNFETGAGAKQQPKTFAEIKDAKMRQAMKEFAGA